MRRTFGAWRGGRAVANLRRAELSLAGVVDRPLMVAELRRGVERTDSCATLRARAGSGHPLRPARSTDRAGFAKPARQTLDRTGPNREL